VGSETFCSLCGKEWKHDESMVVVSIGRQLFDENQKIIEEISSIEARYYCEGCAGRQESISIPLNFLVKELETKEQFEARREEAYKLADQYLEEEEMEDKKDS
jgi:hypothetical protein